MSALTLFILLFLLGAALIFGGVKIGGKAALLAGIIGGIIAAVSLFGIFTAVL